MDSYDRYMQLKDSINLRQLALYQLKYSEKVEAAQTIPEVLVEVTKVASKLLDDEYERKVRGVKSFKSSSESSKYRTAGNESFNNKEWTQSLEHYDDSIAHAPINSEYVAYAFANRSAVLYAMGKLTECISDIHRALDSGYPEKLKYKVLLREGQCLRDLGQSKQAQDCFNLALEFLQKSDLTADKKRDAESVILNENKMEAREVEGTHRVFNPTELPPLAYGASDEVPCVSSALALRYDDTCGRHYVATRNIKIGDTVLVEAPYVHRFVLSSENETINILHSCSHCQNICFTLLPCPNCNWAMFCSKKCMTEAEKYHTVECPIISKMILIHEKDRREALIAVAVVRSIAKLGLENVQEYLDTPVPSLDTDEAKRTRGFNSEGKYDSSDFKTILNLETNFSKISATQKLDYCNISLEIAKCFYPNSYLNCENFTALLCQLYASFAINAMGNSYLIFQTGSIKLNTISTGATIYPALSLFSHSCNANAYAAFYGNKIVVRAKLPISKNQSVAISYFDTYRTKDKMCRQGTLEKHFQFICKCEACVNDWPINDRSKLLTEREISQIPNPLSFIMKIDKVSSNNQQLFSTFDPSLKNRKRFMNFVEKSLNEVAELITILHRKNLIFNQEYYLLHEFLVVLFESYGTSITNMQRSLE